MFKEDEVASFDLETLFSCFIYFPVSGSSVHSSSTGIPEMGISEAVIESVSSTSLGVIFLYLSFI